MCDKVACDKDVCVCEREVACERDGVHANATSKPPSAMPARQSAGGRRRAPRLPCKVPPGATNGDHARHQTQPSIIMPRRTKVDVAKRHFCHVKQR